MFTKAMYIEKRGASLRALEVEIDRLTDYACQAPADVALDYCDVIHDLEISRDRAAKKLRKLVAVSGEVVAWADALRDMENAWRKVRNAVVVAISATWCERVEA